MGGVADGSEERDDEVGGGGGGWVTVSDAAETGGLIAHGYGMGREGVGLVGEVFDDVV